MHIPTIKIKQLAWNVSLFILPPVQELIRAFITDLTFGSLPVFLSACTVYCVFFFLVIQKISLFIKCKHFGQTCFSLKYNTHIQFLTNLLTLESKWCFFVVFFNKFWQTSKIFIYMFHNTSFYDEWSNKCVKFALEFKMLQNNITFLIPFV